MSLIVVLKERSGESWTSAWKVLWGSLKDLSYFTLIWNVFLALAGRTYCTTRLLFYYFSLREVSLFFMTCEHLWSSALLLPLSWHFSFLTQFTVPRGVTENKEQIKGLKLNLYLWWCNYHRSFEVDGYIFFLHNPVFW